jgi:LysM repeat protein
MRSRILVAALALLLGAGLFVSAPTHQASAWYGGNVHCVRYGETLSGIAAMYGTTVWAIANANGLPNPNCVQAGMCLTIPGGYAQAPHGGYAPPPHGGYDQHPAYGGYDPHPAYGGYAPVDAGYHYGGYSNGVYCVRYGDTLSGIAAMYGVSTWSICYANGLPNPNCIYAGQHLKIPGH